jgi:Phage integrase, N-terminal SAM-like domain
MSPLRMRMIEDMKLAGLSPGTQATYIDAVRKLAAYYRRSPDQLSEEEVRAYILNLRERGAARGTFKANYYGSAWEGIKTGARFVGPTSGGYLSSPSATSCTPSPSTTERSSLRIRTSPMP